MQNKAQLVTSGKDVLNAMCWDEEKTRLKTTAQPKLLLALTTEQEKVVNALREKELPIDQLTLRSELPMSKVASVLLELEFDGTVSCLPGKVYKLN
jgi:DNA processing protein